MSLREDGSKEELNARKEVIALSGRQKAALLTGAVGWIVATASCSFALGVLLQRYHPHIFGKERNDPAGQETP